MTATQLLVTLHHAKLSAAAYTFAIRIRDTGSLGDVMKESAQIAYTFSKHHFDEMEPDNDFFRRADIRYEALRRETLRRETAYLRSAF